MKNLIAVIIALSMSLIVLPAHAAITPLSVSVLPPVQFPPSDFDITGLRLSLIYGQHREVYGLDLSAIGNITDQEFVGIGVSGVFNVVKGNATITGLQLAGLTNLNYNKTTVVGVQLAGALNMNTAESSVYGIQAALLANLAENTTVNGLQVGLYNKARSVRGLQIGLVNDADTLYGFQIGLINFHRQGVFTMAPIINFGF